MRVRAKFCIGAKVTIRMSAKVTECARAARPDSTTRTYKLPSGRTARAHSVTFALHRMFLGSTLSVAPHAPDTKSLDICVKFGVPMDCGTERADTGTITLIRNLVPLVQQREDQWCKFLSRVVVPKSMRSAPQRLIKQTQELYQPHTRHKRCINHIHPRVAVSS